MTELALDLKSSAVIDGEYRYFLSREWIAPVATPMVWIMLNPSKADATQDDPTITRIRHRAMRDTYLGRQRIQFGRLVVVNLFALRATDPAELYRHPAPVGPDNDDWIRAAATLPGAVVIAAWGAEKIGAHRSWVVSRMLAAAGVELHCLGVTKSGAPRHPLYIRTAAPLLPYEVKS